MAIGRVYHLRGGMANPVLNRVLGNPAHQGMKGEKICLQLSAEKLGCTPREAYKALHGKFVPGQVYQLVKPIDGVQTGYYIYEREEKAMLVFCLMGMDDEGDACRTDKTIMVHLDFKDYFAPTEMKV